MADVKLNVYQKISQIIDSLGLIRKDSTAPQVMGGYAFTSHGALIGHIRHELTSRNIVIRASGSELLKSEMYEVIRTNPDKSTSVKMNFHSVVKFNFTVVNADDPSDFFVDSWIGEGMDSSDKGVQKAGTSAEKYFLMKLFKVGDKDDPDAVDVNNNSTSSESASMPARANGSPGAFSHRAVAATLAAQIPTTTDDQSQGVPQNQLEILVDQAKPQPPTVTPEITPEQKKRQIEALVWLGEQLPSSMGWFMGKIVPMVSLWETRQKNGKLTVENGLDAPSGVYWVFNQLSEAHIANCGENCEHLLAAKLAVITGGPITDPARV